ncbi:putative glutamate synthase [Corynebacterium imitans]|uniref:Putative glutamate synthase n=1 Tax=Corynebacterium imitans TaxID=156978 RepID=A0A240AP32_9CORY|nr:FMN-binding glutamate synthase family protein [Corynebacterium imitans]SNV84626.1 putative glutamate synthase [Corynebacterium imitans]
MVEEKSAPLVKGALGAAAAALGGVAVHDLTQRKYPVLRNYPVLGHMRYLLTDIGPELRQYFIERDWDGRPFNRDQRNAIYERAKGIQSETAFGTVQNVSEPGHEYLVHSVAPVAQPEQTPRTLIGGKDCAKPYSMSLMNVSAMSFGSLSRNAIRALNKGAELGGFAHDTGEGGLSPYHMENNGDLIWELGTGYFCARTPDGDFDPVQFREKAANDQVKMVELKLSQGAKPGIGGVLPADKITAEVAEIRGIPRGQDCISPARHRVFSTPVELIEFIAQMRELAGGKPVGFKLCVGSRREVLAICKAMREVGTAPDFIVVDGSEGGTGAAPIDFEDHVGMPLTHGLMTVHNALVGTGLRDQVKIGASGKVAGGSDIVMRLIQGADFTNAARAMMMALGCIQAQHCHTGKCPSGVATQDPRRNRAIVVEEKSRAVYNFQKATVAQAVRLMASMGVSDPAELTPAMLRRNVSPTEARSYAELYEWLAPGQLLDSAPASWAEDWQAASADTFRPV